jgi:hypothetical protein
MRVFPGPLPPFSELFGLLLPVNSNPNYKKLVVNHEPELLPILQSYLKSSGNYEQNPVIPAARSHANDRCNR